MSVTEVKKLNELAGDEIEIRLADILQFLKDSRTTAILGGLLLGVIGAFYAFSKPNQYSSQVTVMPEIQSKVGMMSGLSPLAGLAGIDLGGGLNNNVDAVRPEVYPDILGSVPFALQLLRQPVYSQLSGKETSLQTFLEEQGRQSIFGSETAKDESKDNKLPDPRNRSNTLQITKNQEILVNTVHNAVSTSSDKKTGIVTVAATMPDPVVAATLARLSLDYLTNYITSYRTEKARNQVRFLERQVVEANKKYQSAEYRLSYYRDQNRNTYLYTAKIEEQRLQADFLLTQSVYNDLSKQFEQAKIKVSEEAPVFKILEPARIPLTKSAPKRTVIISGFIITGFLMGVLVYGFRRFAF